jgi:general secretion pathway protein N
VKGWALAGVVVGAVPAAVAFAPASWLAGALADATGQRLLLADARGTVWQGSAVLVLTAGAGSRDASALPGRLQWRLGLDGLAVMLHARQACCINGEMVLRVVPGLARLRIELPGAGPGAGPIGQWPASWLVGLGTPWNTVMPSGTLQLSSPGLVLEQVQGRWRFSGSAQLDLGQFASRLSTLDALGSYRFTISGDAARGDATTLALSTLEGALQLSGTGQVIAGKLRFNGQADAAPGSEQALANLLNIIGRRRGASSIISIG